MADRKAGKPAAVPGTKPPATSADSDESERSLARFVAIGLPAGGLLGAVVVGTLAGIGSALLVVAAAALLGTIALLWASVRTLSGDAPLALDLEAIGARRHGVDALSEQKRRVLRALKDLESERAIGKLEEVDYDVLVARYRDEAKTVMREMDLQVAPLRDEAEKVARAFLRKRGLEPEGSAEPAPAEEAPAPLDGRVTCERCQTSNEPDATFCKKCGGALGTSQEWTDADA
jgi:ribosomal protein L40E